MPPPSRSWGGIAAAYAVDFVGPFLAISVYFLIGTVCLWGLASLSFKKALGAMGVFFGYKVATVLVLVFLFTSASSQRPGASQKWSLVLLRDGGVPFDIRDFTRRVRIWGFSAASTSL